MKNKILSVTIAVTALVVALATSAWAWLDDTEVYKNGIEFILNESELTAEMTGIYDGEEYMEIPEYITEYVYDDDYDQTLEKFYVTSITGFLNEDYYGQTVKTIKIPETVTSIGEKTVGWYLDEYYDFEIEDYVEEYKKIDGFTIICVEGSQAEQYAKENGFNCQILKSVSRAVINLSADSFVYSGNEARPLLSVYYNGVKLNEGADYMVAYENNINAGTAAVTVTGKGTYVGEKRVEFKIIPADASSAKVSRIETQYYTGKSIKPAVTVTFDSKTLKKDKDYTVTYTSNKYIGTGKVEIVFSGNYSGRKTVNFTIKMSPMNNAKYASTAYKIKLTWDKIPCSEYRVYRYNKKTGEYDLIKKTTSASYTDKSLTSATAYTYKVRAVVKASGTEYLNKCATVKAATRPKTLSPTISRSSTKVKITWKRDKAVDGYQVGRFSNDYIPWWEDGTESITTVKTIKSNSTLSWKKEIGKNEYVYAVRSYKKLNGKTVYSQWSEPLATGTVEARLNAVKLKSHRDIPVYDTQGEETTLAWTYYLSDSDVKLLEKFAKKHFTSKMSRLDKIGVTLDWINQNVDYAYDYGKISNCSYVEAIFKHKLGQCLQYNGALAAMLAYLGYDARIIQGYRGTWPTNYWQHFWCEVRVSGVTYLCETGNYGKNGYWSYLMTEYPYTSGYIKNHKNI